MKIRNRITQVLLWFAVLGFSTWFGGTLYQMLVIVPLWSESPPESVRAFFLGTRYNETIWNFFGPPFMVARLAPLLGALIVGWYLPQHRKWLLAAAVCMLFNLIFTLVYVYPINDVLFTHAGGNHSPEEVSAMVRQWIMSDRLRFGVGTVGFFALLCALSIPFPSKNQ
jgi:uncharacterized membrane protein